VKNRTLEAFSGGYRRISPSKPSFGGAECKKEKDYAGTHRRKFKKARPTAGDGKTALFGARRP
jgi:hypothetical protein